MKHRVAYNRFYLALLAAGAGLLAAASTFAAESRTVQVAAGRGLNIRDADGEILCAVANNTPLEAVGRHGDGERLRVKFKAPGCRVKEGYVFSSYVRATDGHKQDALVDTKGLNLRIRPNLDDTYWICGLPKDTPVTILPGKPRVNEDASFVKVRLAQPVKGCEASEGYVSEAYLKGVDLFDDLPVVPGTADEEDVADCSGNGCSDQDQRDASVKKLDKLSKRLGKHIGEEATPGPFVDALKKMIAGKQRRPASLNVSRGLVQMPLNRQRGPCGSFHYLPDQPPGSDVYANPLTACVFTAVLQDWKKNVCPSKYEGCRLSFGDISQKNSPLFNGHHTHTDGYCIDIRPMRKGAFADSGLTYQSRGYDRAMMQKLVTLVKKYGASNLYFNDTGLGTKAVAGHHNHIHVCFKDNPTTRAACNNLKVDPNVCPELQ